MFIRCGTEPEKGGGLPMADSLSISMFRNSEEFESSKFTAI